MMVFMPVVLVLIGQFCRDRIGPWNVEVVVTITVASSSYSTFECDLTSRCNTYMLSREREARVSDNK